MKMGTHSVIYDVMRAYALQYYHHIQASTTFYQCAVYAHTFYVTDPFLHEKTTDLFLKPLLYLVNVQDMKKSDSCSYMVVR